jgi:hypothetical protein
MATTYSDCMMTSQTHQDRSDVRIWLEGVWQWAGDCVRPSTMWGLLCCAPFFTFHSGLEPGPTATPGSCMSPYSMCTAMPLSS